VNGADWSGRRLHFIGIGGAGMSGLAVVCAGLGATVTGSDRSESSYMERLRAAGLEPQIGHDGANLPEGAEVVVSTAIAAENPELALARERGQKVIHRGELLAELCAEKRLIAIAGTHGKTTTTAMAVWALRGLGEDPAFFVGGEVPGLGPDGGPANAGWGEGEWVVAEADESDGSFLRLSPEIAVVTNVEMDHHSKWGSLEPLIEAFAGFAGKARVAVLPAPSREGGAVEEVRGLTRRTLTGAWRRARPRSRPTRAGRRRGRRSSRPTRAGRRRGRPGFRAGRRDWWSSRPRCLVRRRWSLRCPVRTTC
jgi:UDP-N-acetylmuramate-alanine ligase